MLKKRKFREIRESEKFNENFPLVFTICTILLKVNRVMRNLRLSSSLKKERHPGMFLVKSLKKVK